jgi:hypothetical protein
MFRATFLSVATLMMATSSIASNLVWYTEPGSNVPAFSTGEKVKGVNLGNWFILVRHRDGDIRIWAGGILIIALPSTGKLDGAFSVRGGRSARKR